MKRVSDKQDIICPVCNKVMLEISADIILEEGADRVQFILECPDPECETQVLHTTYASYESGDVLEEGEECDGNCGECTHICTEVTEEELCH